MLDLGFFFVEDFLDPPVVPVPPLRVDDIDRELVELLTLDLRL